MVETEQFIQLLKNDDTEKLNLIYIKNNWQKDIDFEKVYPEIKDEKNGSVWNIIGYMYNYGYGVEQDYSKALEYYVLSAEQNNADAQLNLGEMYESGNGVEKNYSKALGYYHLSAEQNNQYAQNNIGDMYCYSKGVKQNYSKASEYYLLSAAQNNSYAQNTIGHMYYYGKGVEQNYLKALEYYVLCAEKNDSGAHIMLGTFSKEIIAFYKKNRQLEEKIGELEAEIIELKYRPGGIGYQEAKNEFEKLKN
jgi:TPR repeat protein